MTMFGPLAVMSHLEKYSPSAFNRISLLSLDFDRVFLGGSLNTKSSQQKQDCSDGTIYYEADISNTSCQNIFLTLGRGRFEF